jgi:hypothetical protein
MDERAQDPEEAALWQAKEEAAARCQALEAELASLDVQVRAITRTSTAAELTRWRELLARRPPARRALAAAAEEEEQAALRWYAHRRGAGGGDLDAAVATVLALLRARWERAEVLTPEEAARRRGRLQRADRDEPGARLFYVERTDALVGTLGGEQWVPPGRLTRGDPDELAEAIHAELFTEWDGARSRELESRTAPRPPSGRRGAGGSGGGGGASAARR